MNSTSAYYLRKGTKKRKESSYKNYSTIAKFSLDMNGAVTLILFNPMLVFMKLGMCSDCTGLHCLIRVSIDAFKLELDIMRFVVHKKRPILS